jgi:hypothetical protein
MGEVVRGLRVQRLWLHNIGAHGGTELPAAAAVDDLIGVAASEGTIVEEPWAGAQLLAGALTILGPEENYYEGLVTQQLAEGGVKVAARTGVLLEAARGLFDRVISWLPVEVPFAEGDVNARNNSSIVTMVNVDGKRVLLTADAGVPALSRAWDAAEALDLGGAPDFVQIPHHGSRRNASSAWLDRLLGPIDQDAAGVAYVSVVSQAEKHPSSKIVNAHIRRGYKVVATAGSAKCWSSPDAPTRVGWGPVTPLSPMDESDED